MLIVFCALIAGLAGTLIANYLIETEREAGTEF